MAVMTLLPAAIIIYLSVAVCAGIVPCVPLKNAAIEGLLMPAVGLGTGAYSGNASVGYGGYPECWGQNAGCGPWALNATATYIQVAAAAGALPVRIDNANSYDTETNVGKAMADSGLPRSSMFLTSKVGSGNPMGYLDTKEQIQAVLTAMNVTYVDLMLIHWPTSSARSQEAACNPGSSYNATACRLDTWRALVEAFDAGVLHAIGVSNYNASHLAEIEAAGMVLPAVNQIPVHLYRSSSQLDTIEWCQAHGIVINAYSPLGVPDWHTFPTGSGLSSTTLQDPVLASIAKAHNQTPAAVVINWLWQQGIVTNPRTMRPSHMAANVAAYGFSLTPAEVSLLSSRPQDWCSLDPTFYECAPGAPQDRS